MYVMKRQVYRNGVRLGFRAAAVWTKRRRRG